MEDPSFRTLFVCQVHILLFSDSVDGVVHAHADVLGIIAKALAEQRCAAHMTRIFRNFNAEGDRASGTDADIAIGDVRVEAATDGKTITLDSSLDPALFESGYLAYGKTAAMLTGSTTLEDGVYDAVVTTEKLKPISLLFSNS